MLIGRVYACLFVPLLGQALTLLLLIWCNLQKLLGGLVELIISSCWCPRSSSVGFWWCYCADVFFLVAICCYIPGSCNTLWCFEFPPFYKVTYYLFHLWKWLVFTRRSWYIWTNLTKCLFFFSLFQGHLLFLVASHLVKHYLTLVGEIGPHLRYKYETPCLLVQVVLYWPDRNRP